MYLDNVFFQLSAPSDHILDRFMPQSFDDELRLWIVLFKFYTFQTTNLPSTPVVENLLVFPPLSWNARTVLIVF